MADTPDHGSTVTPLKGAQWEEVKKMRANVEEQGTEYPPPPEMKVTHQEMKDARVRSFARRVPQVRNLPHLLPQPRAPRRNPRCAQGELVGEHQEL